MLTDISQKEQLKCLAAISEFKSTMQKVALEESYSPFEFSMEDSSDTKM
jgi:hypothetical protein